MAPSEQDYVGRLLSAQDNPDREAIRQELLSLLSQRSDTEIIQVTGDLILYLRDTILSSLAGIRRSAAINAKSTMSTDEIASKTGLSKVSVSRLITEGRNY